MDNFETEILKRPKLKYKETTTLPLVFKSILYMRYTSIMSYKV